VNIGVQRVSIRARGARSAVGAATARRIAAEADGMADALIVTDVAADRRAPVALSGRYGVYSVAPDCFLQHREH
jgi:hypothetical protein